MPENPVKLVALRETPLDVAEVVAALDDDASGGLTLFVGRVRDHDGGKAVDGLDYTAHDSALATMEAVVRRASPRSTTCTGSPRSTGSARSRSATSR